MRPELYSDDGRFDAGQECWPKSSRDSRNRQRLADLWFPDAVERQVKLRLAYGLNQLLAGRQLSLFEADKVLVITQPEGAALRRYKLADFSVERLMSLLTALDRTSRS